MNLVAIKTQLEFFMKRVLFSLSLLGLILTASVVHASDVLPARIILGSHADRKHQIWLIEEADSYYVRLGVQAEPLRRAFPSVPYPLDFIEFRMQKDSIGCPTVLNCSSVGNIRIQSIATLQGTYPGETHYELHQNPADNRFQFDVTFKGPMGQQSLSLEFEEADVLVQVSGQ
jgi:hypothetical protein